LPLESFFLFFFSRPKFLVFVPMMLCRTSHSSSIMSVLAIISSTWYREELLGRRMYALNRRFSCIMHMLSEI
jgi:hypothetical protein